jgi:PAS domain S-box-containing protein
MLVNKYPARRHTDLQWRIAFENSAIGVTMADFPGRYFAANSAFLNILGYTESELYQLTFMDVTYEEDRELNLRLIHELMEGKRQHFELEKRYCRKGGGLVWVRTNVALVPGIGGTESFWFAIVEDITPRKEAQGALQVAQAELARMSRLTTMGELAASIAHEINQPLTAITNNSSACLRLLANHDVEPDLLRRILEEIVADSTRAGRVIARIRSFLKKEPTEENKLDVNELILEVLALADHELSRNQVLLECELTKTLPTVLGDRVQLQQVLLNLIINGIEAMTKVTTRPRILRVQSRTCELGNVMVAVCDSGTGLGQDADRLFDPFFTTKANGMGMGLSISRSLIEGHGGRLWATPHSPHGSVFYFTLPAESRRPS